MVSGISTRGTEISFAASVYTTDKHEYKLRSWLCLVHVRCRSAPVQPPPDGGV